jgi:hypothetical protein|tara:strand:- start:1049 stop:1402 length:354 start_codon:yes stop_codon:yes gene_type:complete
MNLDRYKNIVKLPIQYKAIKIVTYLPTPIEFDYKKGYITRYFLQKANDINSPIYEVKQNAMMKYDSNSFYSIVSLDWRLIGTNEEIKQSNSASLRLASAKLPKISLYLPNLLQFHKV